MDGELPGVEHRQVHEHLNQCGECENEYATLLQMKRMLGSLRVQEPRPELPTLILRRVNLAEEAADNRRQLGWQGTIIGLLQTNLRPLALGTGMACVAVFLTAHLAKPEEENTLTVGAVMQIPMTPLAPSAPYLPVSTQPQTYPPPHQNETSAPLHGWRDSYPTTPETPDSSVRLQLTPVSFQRSF